MIFFNAEYNGDLRSLSLFKSTKDFILDDLIEEYCSEYYRNEQNNFEENLKNNGSFIKFLLISGLICHVQYNDIHLVELSKDINERVTKKC